MNRLKDASSLKRKRAEPNSLLQSLTDNDRAVLNVIKSKGDTGSETKDIAREANIQHKVVSKSIKFLTDKNLIKGVKNIQNRGRTIYLATEFEPSKEITGGSWYVDGQLDKEFISSLSEFCLKIIKKLKVATEEGVYDFFKKNKITKEELTLQQITEILSSLVLDNKLIEVKSTGMREYHSIPFGTICYRCPTGMEFDQGPKIGAMASIPCGVCPRISQCTPDGVVSPATCVYFTKWLDF